jgi:hypothetical protein
MSALSIKPPYPAFAGADGLPLENGYIWIGTVNRYPVYQGSPSRFYVGSDYSIQVLDSKGSVVYTSLNGNVSSGSAATNATGNGVQTIFPVTSTPFAIYINGVYQNQNTYTVSGGNVTFSEAPPLTSVIEFLI